MSVIGLRDWDSFADQDGFWIVERWKLSGIMVIYVPRFAP
jgi:hypothetical protein